MRGKRNLGRRSHHLVLAVLMTLTLAPAWLPPAPALAAFLGKNGRIAFGSSRDGDTEIFSIKPDGTGIKQLTKNEVFVDNAPAWSRDGSRIAFISNRDGNFEIYTMKADGTNETRRTDNDANDTSPTWSPNGKRIAFESGRDGNNEIWTMKADGTGLEQLTHTDSTTSNQQPAWSPDGDRIAFISNRDGNQDIWVMSATEGDEDVNSLANLTAEHDDGDFMPDWSPNGEQIAFVSTRTGGNNQEIFTMDADGANPVRQTDFAAIDSLPAWSPNGKFIVFNRDLGGGNFEIVQLTPRVLDTDPVPPVTNLTIDSASDQQPNWQPT
jgi:Tol biopolymer transport system component